MRNIIIFLFSITVCNCADNPQPKVYDFEIAVSIKPIHSLVCALLKNIATPQLLINSNFSPHHFQVTPSQVATINKAKLVIWIGPAYEKPLYKYLNSDKVLALQNCKTINFKQLRNGALWDNSNCCHDHALNSMHVDGHIWLDPAIMFQVADVVLEKLIATYPDHKSKLEDNAAIYREHLKKLNHELSVKMKPYSGITYIIQHDGNQYFDAAFNVKTIATISIDPSIPPCAGHMLKLKKALDKGEINPKCLFAERQIGKNCADTLKIPFAVLDYLGADIKPGEYAYEEIMHAYVDSFIKGVSLITPFAEN